MRFLQKDRKHENTRSRVYKRTSHTRKRRETSQIEEGDTPLRVSPLLSTSTTPRSSNLSLSLTHTHTLGRDPTSLTNMPQVIPAQQPEQEVGNAGTANQSKLPLCLPTHFYSKLTHTHTREQQRTSRIST